MAKFLVDRNVSERVINEYIQGIKELPAEFANRLKLNPSFSKARAFPGLRDRHGVRLTPRYTNPGQLAAYYKAELEKTLANRDFLDSLATNGRILPVEIGPVWLEGD